MNTYRVDGRSIRDIPTLCEAFAKAVNAPHGYFGRNLQAFDDCLFGGFGLDAPCDVIWEYSAVAREKLGSAALARYCQESLAAGNYFDDDGLAWLTETKAKAERSECTLFENVVDSIRSVSERSSNPDWKINLVLL